jgi:hypothetical protein
VQEHQNKAADYIFSDRHFEKKLGSFLQIVYPFNTAWISKGRGPGGGDFFHSGRVLQEDSRFPKEKGVLDREMPALRKRD